MGRLRLWLQVGCVVAVLVAAVLAADRAYESQAAPKHLERDMISVPKSAIVEAYALMASAIDHTETEVIHGPTPTIIVYVSPEADADARWSIESLSTVLPLKECGVAVKIIE